MKKFFRSKEQIGVFLNKESKQLCAALAVDHGDGFKIRDYWNKKFNEGEEYRVWLQMKKEFAGKYKPIILSIPYEQTIWKLAEYDVDIIDSEITLHLKQQAQILFGIKAEHLAIDYDRRFVQGVANKQFFRVIAAHRKVIDAFMLQLKQARLYLRAIDVDILAAIRGIHSRYSENLKAVYVIIFVRKKDLVFCVIENDSVKLKNHLLYIETLSIEEKFNLHFAYEQILNHFQINFPQKKLEQTILFGDLKSAENMNFQQAVNVITVDDSVLVEGLALWQEKK